MNAEQQSIYLKEKFGKKSIEIVKKTINLWKTKKEYQLQKLNSGNRSENLIKAILKCDYTINFWIKVKNKL